MVKIKLLYLGSLLFFLSCKVATELNTDATTIVASTSKLTGKIIAPSYQKKDSILVTIFVLHPISGENVTHEILADQSGEFSLDFDVETQTTILWLHTSVSPYKQLLVKSIYNDSTHIDIEYTSTGDIRKVGLMPAMNTYDMMQTMGVLNKMIDYIPNDPNWKPLHFYAKGIPEFLDYATRAASKRMALFVRNDQGFSKEFKNLIAKDYRLYWYATHVFDYETVMKRDYRNATSDTVNIPKIQKFNRSDFRFLKDFKLNDPQYLHAFTFPELQDSMLTNEVLGLPVIGERDIPSWLASVKVILADLVGFDEGPYYDVLAANAYGRQFKKEVKPLTEKQKENITHYWKNGDIAKILFRKNQQVIELDAVK